MIQEFSLENILSIREKLTISFKATSKDKDKRHIIEMSDGTKLLKLVALFGANGSGKTNILNAYNAMMSYAVDSFTMVKKSSKPDIIPFSFPDDGRPSSFEIIFYHDNVKYAYSLSVRDDKVVSEELLAFDNTQRHLVYTRKQDGGIKWGNVSGEKKAISETTREDATVISTAAALNHTLLKEVRTTLDSLLYPRLNKSSSCPFSNSTSALLYENPELKEYVLKLLNNRCFGNISDITVESIDYPPEMLDLLRSRGVEDKAFLETLKDYRVTFRHNACGNEYSLPLRMESDGTKRIYKMANFLAYFLIPDAVVEMDEIEYHLHPQLLSYLVNLILEISQSSQLLFTTHSYHLLDDTSLLTDGEIYFLQKDDNTLASDITRYSSIQGIRQPSSRTKLYFNSRLVEIPDYTDQNVEETVAALRKAIKTDESEPCP